MKILKLSMSSLMALGWATSSVGAPGDMVQTSNRMVETVQVQNPASGAVYYIVAVGG